ncbi:dihydroneopterin aldolase, also has dihydroneopterin triphosphate 2'-epimerase activity [Candidatus Blochmanniella floridana]|uniref:7,8-dihydroneopterin aldolase n=1 Tax=Blochmanniella floridana TaxID=203907 RepID=Q7VQQ7_BLOFL|nr:dihydroneopterin aldolase, also has dihydroneopterin triphosphate 2'-epimerase activity [Candidatus Blochmannia floridanus]
MDILYINQLIVMSSVGIYDWEKNQLQKLIFDLELTCHDKFFVSNTDMSNYLDYTKISNIILDTINGKHFLLIEYIAEEIIKILMEKFSVISWIRLKVDKPNAVCNARSVGICIERENKILSL